jgi:hypothetical protein
MKVCLYLDEDAMGNPLVKALRSRGVELVTALEVGMIEREDEEHLKYAASEGLTLYSFNRGDYVDLHTRFLETQVHHAGIILSSHNRYSVGEQMRRLIRLVETLSAEDMKDRMEFLTVWGE